MVCGLWFLMSDLFHRGHSPPRDPRQGISSPWIPEYSRNNGSGWIVSLGAEQMELGVVGDLMLRKKASKKY